MDEQQTATEPADDFAAFLAQYPIPSEVVEFPRADGIERRLCRVRIRVLPMVGIDAARSRAFRKLTGPGRFSPRDLTKPIPLAIMQDAVAREVLCEACCSVSAIPLAPHAAAAPPTYARTFRDPEHMSKLISDGDLRWLWDQYLRIASASAPVFVTEPEDEDLTEEDPDAAAE